MNRIFGDSKNVLLAAFGFIFLVILFLILGISESDEPKATDSYTNETSTLQDIRDRDAATKGEVSLPKAQPVEANGTEWDANNFRQSSSVSYDGITYIWKSLSGDLDFSVSDEGYVIDSGGFIVCSSSEYEIGTELWSPLGYLKVYYNHSDPGCIEVMTKW